MSVKTNWVLWLKVLMVVLVLYLGKVSNVICFFQPQHVPIDKQQLAGSGKIYFIPVDDFPRPKLENLARFYQNKYGLQIEIRPTFVLPQTVYNPKRQQVAAQAPASLIKQQYASSGHSEGAIHIAFTDHDMYIEKYNWNYAFSYREPARAVVSSARMNIKFMAVWPPDEEWQETRLRKMVTKNIGVLYYHLPLSDNCRSVLYADIGGPQELDFMDEEL